MNRDRARAERALQEWKVRLRSLVENAADIVAVARLDGTITYVSPAIRSVGGYEPAEVIGRNYLALVLPEDLPEARRHLAALAARPVGPLRFELRFRHKDGSTRHVESVVRNLTGTPGIDGIVVNMRDVTERSKRDEEKQAERMRTTDQFEAVKGVTDSRALLTGDIETMARQITEAAARVTGAARANVWLFNEDETELRCIDLFEATPGKHSSGMVLKESEFRNEFQAFKGAGHVAADDPLTDPRTAGYVERYLRPLRITSMLDTVIAVAGEHKGLLCIEHVDKPHHWEPDEITFASQLADRLRLCLANRHRNEVISELEEAQRVAHIGHWQLTPAIGAFRWSQELNRILGREPSSAPLSFDELAQTLPPESRARMKEGFGEVMRSGLPHESDLEVVLPSGAHRWIAVRAEPIRDAQGETVALRGTVQDITESKTTTLLLNERVKEQRCLHLVAALGARPDLSEDSLLRQVPELLVPAFRYPELTCARIVQKDRVFASPDFTASPWLLVSELRVDGAPEGRIEVCYRQERPPAAESPFLTEERALLDTVATILGRAIAGRRLAERLQAAKALLEGVLNAIPARVFWKNRDLVYLGCNAPFARDAGFADPQEIIGKDDSQMGWRDQAELYRGDDREVIESGHAKVLIEEPQTTPDGQTTTLLTSKVPLRDARGDVIGVLGAYMDISDLKAKEATLRAQLEELQRWQSLNLDREDRILELKREVNRALAQVGQRARYENA